MKVYKNIYLEAIDYLVPESIISSEDIEEQLIENYQRFNFHKGRLEFFTGIKERKYWGNASLKPSDVASQAAKKCLEKNHINPSNIDVLIFCSVCRDFLEPASSTLVHNNLKLKASCQNFDLSNACLGMISGIEIAAAMIQSGQAQKALLVSGEIGYPLLKETIKKLQNKNISKEVFKEQFSSLTIGSGASAIVISSKKNLKNKFLKICSSRTLCHTNYNSLCQGNYQNEGVHQEGPLMGTQAQKLLEKGIILAKQCWDQFLQTCRWGHHQFNKVYHHQVGSAHTKKLYAALKLKLEQTYQTFPFLGNCGSASLPITLAMAKEKNHLQPKDKIALLGIGSGINCTMLSLKW